MSVEYGRRSDENWEWPCRLLEVTDGDSIVVIVDRGFGDRSIRKIRLYGVDTAEIHNTEEGSSEYEKGMRQKRFVERWFNIDTTEQFPFTLHTYEREGKYGRWLGDVSLNENSLSEAILDEWPYAHY